MEQIREILQGPVVQMLDSSIQHINHYPVGQVIGKLIVLLTTGQRVIQWIVLSTFWTTRPRFSSLEDCWQLEKETAALTL